MGDERRCGGQPLPEPAPFPKARQGGRDAATKIGVAAAILLVFAACFAAKGWMAADAPDEVADPAGPKRIVSMAPAVTETLFALGCGDRVAGVTAFCQYPPEAAGKPRIGGLLDPNFEAVMALRPDLVVMLDGLQSAQAGFDNLRVKNLAVPLGTVDGILDAIPTLGRVCGAEKNAERIVADIRARIARIERKTAGLPRWRVMVTIERTLGTGGLQDVYVGGRDGYFDRIIAMAGGENVYRDGLVRFPVVSAEGMLNMNPQVVIELFSSRTAGRHADAALLADWQQLAEIEAVRQRRVYIVREDFAFVPGPRFILLVEKFARLVHPEVDWGS